MIIGKTTEGDDLPLNLDKLIDTRALIQANSGGGKSWAIRRILEQTHGKVQQIVIDVEDEFHTLREKYDYVLAGSTGGDCPADVRTAPVLARRLLELGASCIVGIFELKAHDRVRFVRQFLDAMVNAPRELWHPVLVVVDEAHVFCPQHGEAESASAVIDLMTRGRKRGFCGILATQRISKLHKDAAAEANNKLIGRSALDVDMKRAADELGFSGRDQQLSLRAMKPGEFYAFGPAVSDVITKIKVGDIKTTHPRAGNRVAPPAPPRETIRAVLSKLGDLPKQAQEEQNTIRALQEKVRALEQKSRGIVAVDPAAIEKARQSGYQHGFAEAEKRFRAREMDVRKAVAGMMAPYQKLMSVAQAEVAGTVFEPAIIKPYVGTPRQAVLNGASESIPRAERLILAALSNYPEGRSKVQVALLTEYAHSGGSFNNALGALRSKGWIEGGSDLMRITPAGAAAIGPVQPLPVGVDLLRRWQGQMGKAEREVLDVLFEVYPEPLTKTEIADRTPSRYQSSGGSFNNALGKLRTLELIKGRGKMVLSEELVDA